MTSEKEESFSELNIEDEDGKLVETCTIKFIKLPCQDENKLIRIRKQPLGFAEATVIEDLVKSFFDNLPSQGRAEELLNLATEVEPLVYLLKTAESYLGDKLNQYRDHCNTLSSAYYRRVANSQFPVPARTDEGGSVIGDCTY